MCGIVGFVTDQKFVGEQTRYKMFKEALIIDSLRGAGGTGVFGGAHGIEEGDTLGWCKAATDGADFVYTSEHLRKFLAVKDSYRFMVGHNRHPTVGSISVENTHPFTEGAITLVHNGSLWDADSLPMPMDKMKDVHVDSHAIARNLAHHSVDEVISNIDGAFCLVWYDNRDLSLNMIRNGERPMHIAKLQGENTLFFMSEAEMIGVVTARAKVGVESIHYPPPGLLLTWKPGSITPVTRKIELSSRNQWTGRYVSSYHYAPPRYPAASSTVNVKDKVLIRGVWTDVPDVHQEAMLEYDCVVEDRLTFMPTNFVVTNKLLNKGIVEGTIGIVGMDAMVYDVSQLTFDSYRDQAWTVRPIGVYTADTDKGTYDIIIAKVVTVIGDNNNKDEHVYDTKEEKHTPEYCHDCYRLIHEFEMADAERLTHKKGILCPDCVTDEIIRSSRKGAL